MTAVTGRDPGRLYADLVKDLGEPSYQRLDAAATQLSRCRFRAGGMGMNDAGRAVGKRAMR